MKIVRVSAKAVIIENGRILLLKHAGRGGEWYSLPGGGQENGETLKEALIRECREEINATVEVKNILFVRDYIAENHEFKDAEPPGTHQLEIMFACSVEESYTPLSGTAPDSTQTGVVWIELERLADLSFYPQQMRSALRDFSAQHSAIYLGDIN